MMVMIEFTIMEEKLVSCLFLQSYFPLLFPSNNKNAPVRFTFCALQTALIRVTWRLNISCMWIVFSYRDKEKSELISMSLIVPTK